MGSNRKDSAVCPEFLQRQGPALTFSVYEKTFHELNHPSGMLQTPGTGGGCAWAEGCCTPVTTGGPAAPSVPPQYRYLPELPGAGWRMLPPSPSLNSCPAWARAEEPSDLLFRPPRSPLPSQGQPAQPGAPLFTGNSEFPLNSRVSPSGTGTGKAGR